MGRMHPRRIPLVKQPHVSGPGSTESLETGAAATVAPSPVPLMAPERVYAAWGPKAEADLLQILRSGHYVKGAHVSGIETEMAEFLGVRHALAVDSGTDALWLVLRAVLADRPADQREVVLPTFTFIATASAVVNAGGTPVFADVDPDSMNISARTTLPLITERTAAVVPVHIFGNPVDMPALREAVGPDMFLLEDAAQAIDATLDGTYAGGLADAGTFSFYPSKNLGAAGDGGMVTTNSPELATMVEALREHGRTKKLYSHERIGTNSRMDEMQAAVLRAKLPHLAGWTQDRRAVAARYDAAFAGTAIRPQAVDPRARSAYHLYTVRVPDRDGLKAALGAQGIASGIYYPVPLHLQACFPEAAGTCPTAESLAGAVLSLPCFPGLREDEQDRVITTVLAETG